MLSVFTSCCGMGGSCIVYCPEGEGMHAYIVMDPVLMKYLLFFSTVCLGSSLITLTKLNGNIPILSPIIPLIQSSLIHSVVIIISPILNGNSPSASVTKSNIASHLPVATWTYKQY